MTKIEEVARVIAATLPGESWQGWTDAARAAIEAISEPSETMLRAANALPVTKTVDGCIYQATINHGGTDVIPGPPDTPIQQWWRAMCQAILAETP